MNRDELGRYVGVTGFSLGQVEKDYIQHIVLGGLSRKVAGMLVFKGGTALQKTGVVRRFSEDLDFTARGDPGLGVIARAAKGAVENYNYHAETDTIVDRDMTSGFRLKLQGPLYARGKGQCSVRIEISKRETVLLKPRRTELAPPYADVLPYILDVMMEEEILAEKLRALSTRQKARDLYDVFMLLKKGVNVDTALAQRKLDYYGLKLDVPALLDKVEVLKTGWERELGGILEDVPQFKQVLASVKRAIGRTR
jgi:predicted nucleotidyltransferase component of viral defense system